MNFSLRRGVPWNSPTRDHTLQGGVQLVPGKIEGKVVSYSEAGNLVTDIPVERLRAAPRDPSVTVTCDEHQTVGLYAPDHKEPEMTLLALLSDSGFLELVIVGDSAKIMLGVRPGQAVMVQW
jgi:S-adenosylmethionine hydrolase